MATDLVPSPLLPWQKVYAAWTVGHDKLPAIPTRVRQASVAATYPVKKADLLAMEARPAFRAYCAELQASAVAKARQLVETETVRTMEQMLEMRDEAHRNKDYAKFMQYAGPVLDRLWPKQDDRGPAKTQVVIQMAPNGFAAKALSSRGTEVIEETDVVVLANPEPA